MGLFKKILNFEKSEIKSLERRKSIRYKPCNTYPLNVSLIANNANYSCSVLDFSIGGLRLNVKDPKELGKESIANLTLQLQQYNLHLKARCAHIRKKDKSSDIGFDIYFPSWLIKKDYIQTLMPVITGSSLKKLSSKLFNQDDAGFKKEVYISDNNTKLITWYTKGKNADGHICNFEFSTDEFVIRSNAKRKFLEIYLTNDDFSPYHIQGADILNTKPNSQQTQEIKQFFVWTTQNFQNNIPKDAKVFIDTFL